MALAEGKNGGVTGLIDSSGGSHNANIERWQAEIDIGIEDTSNYADDNGGWRTHSTSLKGGRGSALGYLNTSNAPSATSVGGTATLTLSINESSPTCTYSGAARVFNVKPIGSYKAAAPRVSFQFIFEGPITETWT